MPDHVGKRGPKSRGSRKLRMKECLHLTEAFYHSLVESLPQFIIRKDRDGRLTFANQRYCDMLGKPLAELLGKSDADLYPADLAEKYRQDDLQVMESGKAYDIEEANIVPGQDTRHVRVVKVPIRDRAGKVVGVQGIFWDITDQKKSAQALVEQSHLLTTIMDNLPDFVYFKDKNSRFTRVNRALATALGLPDPAAAVGKVDGDFFPPEQATRQRRDEKQVMDTAEPIVAKEETVTLPDGSARWYATTKMPFKNRSGRIVGTFGVSRDITDRKRAELALLQQLELFNCLMDSLPDCVYFKDAESRFTRVNKFLVHRFGIGDPSALLGKNDFDLFTPEHARPAFEDEQSILRTGRPIIGKLEKETFPDGTVKWVSTTKMAHRDTSGQIVGTFGISRDITDWKRTEDRLAEQLALFDCLMDSLPDCVYFKDRQSRFIRANKATLARRGFADNAQIAGKCDADFFTDEHALKALRDEQEILRTGQPLVGMVEKETLSDGGVRWVVTSKMPLRDATGEIVGTFGVTRDITDWKRAEEQMAEQASLLDTLMVSSPDSIYFKDRQGRFLWISRAMAARHGLHDPAEARGKTDFDFFPEAHARQTAAEEEAILQTGTPVVGKIEKKTLSDGSVRWSSTTKAPFRDKAGTIIGTFGITRDITDQHPPGAPA
jgi:PAS domain S-box-containing protein